MPYSTAISIARAHEALAPLLVFNHVTRRYFDFVLTDNWRESLPMTVSVGITVGVGNTISVKTPRRYDTT